MVRLLDPMMETNLCTLQRGSIDVHVVLV